jgi:CHAT domain-containing protein
MMSLWKVDNEATTLLMTTFYREWLSTGNMDKAFKKAKQIVRDEYHDPYYWAGFVLLDTNGI